MPITMLFKEFKGLIHMFIIRNFLMAVAGVLDYALNIYVWIIIARAVLSWVSPDPYNPIVSFIYRITEPVLARIRAWLPASFGGVDISPIVALLAIYFLQHFVITSLYTFARIL